jgi:aryl-alcohol dehydrogenase-like predicted oxidoreductase
MNNPSGCNRRTFLKTVGIAGASMALNRASLAQVLDVKVPKRKLGRHDEMVSSLGLGGYTLAVAKTVEESTRIAHEAIDCGVTFFDNCWEYHDGRAEEWMGAALAGKRDQVFLMTKVCTHLPGKQGKEPALAMLDQSLARLKTDHVDLWQIHQVGTEAEADAIFAPGGAIEAVEQARKQGKIRYCGFTGHRDPKMHLRVLAHKYPFDTVQMPLSVFDSHADGFQKLVLPELLKQGIAPLAMKTLGGNAKSIRDGVITADEALRYSLSLPITTLISGINSVEWLRQNAGVAASFKPYSPDEMAALEKRIANKDQYEAYRHWAYLDGHSHFSNLA